MIIQLTIPIHSTYNEDNEIYYQELFFNVLKGSDLTKEKVLKIVQDFHERDKDENQYDNCWLLVIDSINKCEEWQYVTEHGLIMTNSFVYGFDTYILKAPISWKVINPIVID